MTFFDSNSLYLHKKRAHTTFPHHAFLFDYVERELKERVQESGKAVENSWVLTSEKDLPEPQKAEVILSCLQAHWINDLPGFLASIRRCLSPKGLFLGALWGGESLYELRTSLFHADIALKGRAAPRVAPMVRPKDMPSLLVQAGFSNAVVDVETLTLTYSSLNEIMKELRGMGETNILYERPKQFTSRQLFVEAERFYQKTFATLQGTLPVTVEIIYVTGWASDTVSQTFSARS